MIGQPAQRPQLQAADVKEPVQLRRVLNQTLLELCARIEALEAAKGITVLPEIQFEIGGALAPTSSPFLNGGLRVTCPFTPTGVVLLRLQPIWTATGTPPLSVLASDVKWRFAAGRGGGDVIIDFVTGLTTDTRYQMRLGVTRA